MIKGYSLLAAAFLAASFGAVNAQTDGVVSAYSKWDIKTCRTVEKEEAFQTYSCRGYAGIAIIVGNEEDSLSVSLGKEDLTQPEWPLGSFIFAKNVVEWRGLKTASGMKPYAAIVRYDIGKSVGGPFRQWLVVYRITADGNSCLATKVDAHQPDANGKARVAADTAGKSFQCGRDRFRS